MSDRTRTILLQYGGAVVFTAAMVLLRWLLDPWLGDNFPFTTLYGGVALTVWYGGYRPGVVAVVVGYLACDYLFIEPRDSFAIGQLHDYVGLGMYLLSCSIIIGLAEGMRVARRQAEGNRTRLAKIMDQIRIVTDSMDAPVTRCSRDLRYVWANKPYANWIGKPVDEIVGHAIVDIIGPKAFERLEPFFNRALSGEKVEYEDVVDFARIGPRWINAIYTPTFDADGAADGWVAVVLDVTDRKRMEQALQHADKLKDEFLATLAHELRNPLAPIRSGLDLLKMAGDDQEIAKDAQATMQRQVDQLVRLVDDLLDVSRIKRGKLELRKELVRLDEVIQCAVETSRPLIVEKGHELILSPCPGPIVVDADFSRLAQVFSNLLNNAAKYTDQGGRIWLTVELQGSDVVVAVKDTGIGIPGEMMPMIFDMFTQAEKSPQRTQGGLGIGLTLAKQVVEMHGGRLDVQSEGQAAGSKFSVRLPVAVSQQAVPRKDGEPADQGVRGLPSRRILIVDDLKQPAQSLASLLRLRGQDVSVVFDGASAIESVVANKPDIAFIDLGMPGMNGYEVAQRIRALPELKAIVLVALTGYVQEEARQRALEAGFDHYLLKPAEMRELERILLANTEVAKSQ